ncbi:TetR/AcrR family transcriptional regulator [Pseudomonas sp. S31]|uniref:TetR/AcrR family transcriptional regulator n=1 Tax=Pseudomonas sp. S31 TaxID=1564473 RepID=UPI0019147DD7|nr:TetR/AcrR family transcriptional regulator [Pseudomonas sp. S31]MBK5000225.1 TetR/AcrR family transcriptional regulator [Pseudomonas sp. S31]
MPAPNAAARHPDTYQRLREAALAMFCAKGYQGTSLRDLARDLGVQAGSLYHHIESKQALLFELLEEALECLLSETRRALKDPARPQLRLRRFVLAWMNVQASQDHSLRLLERETCHLSAIQQARIDQLRQAHQACLQGILANLAPTLMHSPRHLQMLTQAVLGMMQGALPLVRQGPAAGEGVEQLLAIIQRAVQAPAGHR